MELFMMAVTAVVFLFNSRLGALFLLAPAAHCIFSKKGSLYERLLNLIVYTVPYYPYSIFGDRQRLSMCIVAVMLLCVLLTARALKNRTAFKVGEVRKLILLLIFVAGYCMSILWGSQAKMETLFATYQLVVLAYLTFIISISKNEALKDVDTEHLMKLFLQGVCAVAIALYIQYGMHSLVGLRLGDIFRYSSGRVIYNVYFPAKSVLSLYYAVGMLYYFTEYLTKKQRTSLVWLALLAGTFWMNNSRTGLACLVACAVVYCARNFKRTFKNVQSIIVLIAAGIVGFYIVQYMLESRSGLEGIADDNGRSEQIVEAFRLLPKYIFWGLGGSAQDYLTSSIGEGIHNFFVAHLIQFGVFGGLAVNFLLLAPALNWKNRYWYYLCCVILGGMFFTHWQNAVYIFPVYIVFLLDSGKGAPLQRVDNPGMIRCGQSVSE